PARKGCSRYSAPVSCLLAMLTPRLVDEAQPFAACISRHLEVERLPFQPLLCASRWLERRNALPQHRGISHNYYTASTEPPRAAGRRGGSARLVGWLNGMPAGQSLKADCPASSFGSSPGDGVVGQVGGGFLQPITHLGGGSTALRAAFACGS